MARFQDVREGPPIKDLLEILGLNRALAQLSLPSTMRKGGLQCEGFPHPVVSGAPVDHRRCSGDVRCTAPVRGRFEIDSAFIFETEGFQLACHMEVAGDLLLTAPQAGVKLGGAFSLALNAPTVGVSIVALGKGGGAEKCIAVRGLQRWPLQIVLDQGVNHLRGFHLYIQGHRPGDVGYEGPAEVMIQDRLVKGRRIVMLRRADEGDFDR